MQYAKHLPLMSLGFQVLGKCRSLPLPAISSGFIPPPPTRSPGMGVWLGIGVRPELYLLWLGDILGR